jgi:hypothetical protein
VVRQTADRSLAAVPEQRDFVHYDFTLANLLSSGAGICGVIEVNLPALTGDRAFDLATVLFYLYDRGDFRERVQDRALELTSRTIICSQFPQVRAMGVQVGPRSQNHNGLPQSGQGNASSPSPCSTYSVGIRCASGPGGGLLVNLNLLAIVFVIAKGAGCLSLDGTLGGFITPAPESVSIYDWAVTANLPSVEDQAPQAKQSHRPNVTCYGTRCRAQVAILHPHIELRAGIFVVALAGPPPAAPMGAAV